MEHKFKVGDRVRVTKIAHDDFYAQGAYKIGDVGIIIDCEITNGQNTYRIDFDRLKSLEALDWHLFGTSSKHYAFEYSLEFEKNNQLMVFE